MKNIILTFIFLSLSSIVCGQPSFQNGEEYAADKNTYVFKHSVNSTGQINRHYHTFVNINNKKREPEEYKWPESFIFESVHNLMEILSDVYGDELHKKVTVTLQLYFGMDGKVIETEIGFISENEQVNTTIHQIEILENLIKNKIRIHFDRNNPAYRNTKWFSFDIQLNLVSLIAKD